MKYIVRFLVVCFIAGFANAADIFLEGKYRGPVDDSAGRHFEFSNGRFTCTYFTDAGRSAPAKKGTYQVHGPRVYLIGDDPNFGEVLFFQTIDGVPLLLMNEVFAMYRARNRISRYGGDYYAFVCSPSEREPDLDLWWSTLLTKHPAFAELIKKNSQ